MAFRYYAFFSGVYTPKVCDCPQFSSKSSAIAFAKSHAIINERGRAYAVVCRLSDNERVADFTYFNGRWYSEL